MNVCLKCAYYTYPFMEKTLDKQNPCILVDVERKGQTKKSLISCRKLKFASKQN